MKAFFIISFAVFWLCIFTALAYFVGLNKIDISYAQFKTDNIILSFDYPSTWTYTIDSDLSDNTASRIISLKDSTQNLIINISQFPTFDTSKKCEQYNDCMFQNVPLEYQIKKGDFDIISSKYDVVFPKEVGVDNSWDGINNIMLSSTPPLAGTLYNLYSKLNDGFYSTIIPIENTKVVITYEFKTDAGKLNSQSMRTALERIINTIEARW